MNVIQQYLSLSGKTTKREALKELAKKANKEDQFVIASRLRAILKNYPDTKTFKIAKVEKPSGLNGVLAAGGIEQLPFNFSDGFTKGLNKGVSPNEIYQYITDTLLQLIQSGKDLPWRKPWSDGKALVPAMNFVSKNGYRGINYMMLNHIYPQYPAYRYKLPYFLTFKQIESLKGRLKQGAKGYRVVYFTLLYRWQDAEKGLDFASYKEAKFRRWVTQNLALINRGESFKMSVSEVMDYAKVPILKYYNVFNADKIEGIDWGKLPKTEEERPFTPVEVAEQIVDLWSDRPPIKHGGSGAFYDPKLDQVTMPNKGSFNGEAEYYGTLFHELIHSTGSKNRLKRNFGGRFGDEKYAFEELIAELGASFLNGEAGLLFHTMHNSAAYLKGWRSRLVKAMQDDNKFFFRASSAAQAAADMILERDSKGVPKYIREDQQKSQAIKDALKNKPKGKPAVKKPAARAKTPENLSQFKKSLTKGIVLWYYHFGGRKLEKRTVEKMGTKTLETKSPQGESRFGDLVGAKDWSFTDQGAFHAGKTLMTTFGYFYKKPTEKQLTEALRILTGVKPRKSAQLVMALNGPNGYKDLWEDWEKLPKEIQNLTDQLNEAIEEADEKAMKAIESKFLKAGYKFDTDFEGNAFGLRKVNSKKKGLNQALTPDQVLEKAEKVVQIAEKGREIVSKVQNLGNVLSIEDMMKMKFEKLAFTGKWAEFMQNVPPNLRLMVYGQGKNGKTSFSFQFAEYLSQFGRVLYNLADQGISATTQDLIRSTGLYKAQNIVLSGGRTIEELSEVIQASDPQFIFIDLMNNYDVDPRTFENFMKQEFPDKGFILVMEATKGEDFRGEGTWLNIVDAKIFCKDFVAYNNGRLGFGEFVIWPDRVKQMRKEKNQGE